MGEKMTNIIRLNTATKRRKEKNSNDSDQQPALEALIRTLNHDQREKAFKAISMMITLDALEET